MRYFPVFLDLAAGPVVLVGSGAAALTKLRLLHAANARVRWFRDDAAGASSENANEVISGVAPDAIDLTDAVAVVSAEGSSADEVVAARARALRIPVNVVDRPELSTFIVPAIVDRGDVVVAIGTGGLAPVLARRLRARIEALLPARIGELAALMGRYRARLAGAIPTYAAYAARRRFWERVVDGPIGAALLAGRPLAAEAALARAIRNPANANERTPITLIGGGLGDPDLLTLRALNALQDADVIFHEGVSAAILDCARRDAERVVLNRATEQQVHAAARAGRRVVVLAHGDADPDRFPFLRAAGAPIVRVPGVAAVTITLPAAQEAA